MGELPTFPYDPGRDGRRQNTVGGWHRHRTDEGPDGHWHENGEWPHTHTYDEGVGAWGPPTESA